MDTSVSTEMSTGRMEAFSDGVFGVAVTLLILNIAVPQLSNDTPRKELIDALLNQWPAYLGYFVSFATVGAVWVGHHRMLKFLARVDHTFQLLNILFLMGIVTIPFTTSLLTRYLASESLVGVVAFVYGIPWLVSAFIMMTMWRYLRRAKLMKPGISAEDLKNANQEFNGRGVIFSLVGMIVVIISPLLSILIYAAAAVLNFLLPLLAGFYRLRRIATKP